jgi:tRNA threonylcarbamoyladenosine biosynthesis protein TsaB
MIAAETEIRGPRMLVFDTASSVIGVAAGWGEVRAERSLAIRRGAEGALLPWAEETATACGFRLAELDGIGVVVGPGTFTGVRVGIATATGLAMALGVQVVPASALAMRAARVDALVPVLAMLDARKARVYAALFDGAHVVHEPADVAPEVAVGWCGPGFVATGQGAVAYQSVVEAAGGTVVDIAGAAPLMALLDHTGRALGRGGGVDPALVRPEYIRAPDAVPTAKRERR